MQAIFEAIVLGIIQGLTEFLPVSSSGHLELAEFFLGKEQAGSTGLLMTVTLHLATALSTIVVFRKDILEIFQNLLQFKWNKGTQFSFMIVLSMIPAAIVGVLFDDILEQLFNGQILLVACMLFLTGGLLFLADRAKDTGKAVNPVTATIIGLAQAIAIIPGISRSGATISTSVLLGIDREKAARFSFLMVVPLIFGKMAKDLLDPSFFEQGQSLSYLGTGFIAAFLTGLLACNWMIKLVKQSKLIYFALYCLVVGLLAIAINIF